MPISGHGWELHVQRLGVQKAGTRKRTYGAYQAYRDGAAIAGRGGDICEPIGPGHNTLPADGKRIAQGRYRLGVADGPHYHSVSYADDTAPAGQYPMPGVSLILPAGGRSAILVHPAHPPADDLLLSSVGCLNPTGPLASDEPMDFNDSRGRVIALIDALRAFAPAAFADGQARPIPNAWIVIDGEPMTPVDAADGGDG